MEKQNLQSSEKLDTYILENTPQRTRDRYYQLASYAAEHDFGVLDEDVVVIDTETTGFSFSHDELIQIAAARMVKGQIVGWYVTFVDPGKPIPEDVAHLTNISDDDVAGAPDPDEALRGLVEFVGDSDVVAHNANFDRTFVTKRAAGESLKQNRWIDSLDLARIALPRLTSHRLLDLVRAFDGPESTHRADDDVAATCVVYRILLAAVATLPPCLIHVIAQMDVVENWNTVYVFQRFDEMVGQGQLDQKSLSLAGEPTRESTAHNEGGQASGKDQPLGDEQMLGSDESIQAEHDSILEGASAFTKGLTYDLRKARKESLTKTFDPLRPDANSPASGTVKAATDQNDLDSDASAAQIKTAGQNDDSAGNAVGDAPNCEYEDTSSSDDIAPRVLSFVDDSVIERAFSSEGLLGELYEDYEPREEQREMALAVHAALSRSRNLAVEAGTGVGKSMAYLVPLAYAAKENGITVGIATKTNALLDQLVNKELPLLSKALGITYAPLKGFNHYPCLRKVESLVKQGPSTIEYKKQPINQAPSLAGLLSFIEQSDYDDMDALKIDYRAIPRRRITTKSAECLRRKCPFFGRSCFVHGAREQAQRCDVVVTNHSLMFWDVRFNGGLLPPVRYWAIDEAHGAESEARRAFSLALSSEELLSLVRRITGESSSNVLVRVQRSAQASEEGQALYDALISKARTNAEAFAIAAEEFCLGAKDLLFFDQKTRSRGYERFDLWLNDDIRSSDVYRGVVSRARALYDILEKLIRATRDIVAYAEQMEDSSSAQRELALVALELRELYETLDIMFFHENENNVYSVRLNRTKGNLDEEFSVQPLDLGASLNESLYAETRSVIYTSATLTIDGKFDAFERAVGFNQSEYSGADTLQVESSYDFDSNMHIYVPTDMPEPQDPGYLTTLQSFLVDLHRAQEGSLLTLFTNRREMENCFDVVRPALKEDDLRLVCQKWGVSVKGLKDDFLKDEHLSLFALKSFWEGFDAPGSTLKGVVIPKLPFGLPTDPLSCERQQRDDRAWAHYSLPAAVIEVKQAVGRLIRTATDTGIVVLADKRLITKYYGKAFLNSLPSRSVTYATCDEIVEDVIRRRTRA